MGAALKPGFTIIETILVLTITAVLAGALIVGTSSSINAQRYNDAVVSLRDVLQSQYAELTNVVNARANNLGCDTNARTAAGTQNRGQSDCVIVGRYLTIKDDGTIEITSVNASSVDDVQTDNDIDDLRQNYNLGVASPDPEVSELEWDTTLPRALTVLIIRSPKSGQTYTFTTNTTRTFDSVTSTSLKNLLVLGRNIPGQGEQTLCVDSNGLTNLPNQAVFINSFAATASAIEIRSNDVTRELGGATLC